MNRAKPATWTRWDAIVVALAAILPTLFTWWHLVAAHDSPMAVRHAIYGSEKILQLLVPALWVFVVQRRASGRRPTTAGIVRGTAFGLAVFAATYGAYLAWLRPLGCFDGAMGMIHEKAAGFGLTSPARLVVWGLFIAAVNSLVEEYFWRWFVFGELRRQLPLLAAVALSSAAFTAHHVVLLGTFFGWTSPLMPVFSLAVALGGVVWCWLYHRTGSLVGPWVSHVLVDAAIIMIACDLLGSFA